MLKEKIVIWGASITGDNAYNDLNGDYHVDYYCDNDKDKWASLRNGVPVISPDQLLKLEYVREYKIIIASHHSVEIITQLKEMNLQYFEVYFNSKSYWEERYSNGGHSGSGSYNRLSAYKAEVINNFLIEHNISNAIEWGCGDGHQLSLINYSHYVGIDVSKTSVELCKGKFSNKKNYRFFTNLELEKNFLQNKKFDISLSLDVIYHLVEDDIYEVYMQNLFKSSQRFVCIYADDIDVPYRGGHVKHRNFSHFVKVKMKDWKLSAHIKNTFPYNPEDPYNTSWSDFYFFEYKGD